MRETCLEQRDLLATVMQNYEATQLLHSKLETIHDSLYGVSPADCSPPNCPFPSGDTGVLAICELNTLSLEALNKKVDVIIASLGRINAPASCGSMQSPGAFVPTHCPPKSLHADEGVRSRSYGCSQVQQPDPCDEYEDRLPNKATRSHRR